MKGKTCLITGANSGIGKAVALGLAQLDANVILVCRDKAKGEAAVEEIKNQCNSSTIDLLITDLSSMKAVKQLAKSVKKAYKKLDVLVLNAGGFNTKRQETTDGYEMTMAVSFLSRFLLTNRLLRTIKASAPSKIISVIGSHQAKTIDFEDFMMEENYKASKALARTTFANLVFIQELARKLDGNRVVACCVDPGFTRTDFVEKDETMSAGLKFAFKLFKPFGKSPAKAAETIIHLASSSNEDVSNGGYYANMKKVSPSSESLDEDLAKKLWSVAKKLTK